MGASAQGQGLFEWMHGRVAALLRQAGHALPPGAPEVEVRGIAERLGVAVPRSYARLLALQNGWPGAWRGISLVSAAEIALEADLLIVGRASDGSVLAFELGDALGAADVGEPPVLLLDRRGKEVERFTCFNEWLRHVAEEGLAE